MAVLAGVLLAGVSACSATTSAAEPSPSATQAAAVSLDDLVAAAKADGAVTVWDSSGKITDIGTAFTAKYGIPVNAVKISADDSVQKLTAEAQAGHQTADVVLFSDGAVLGGQLFPQKVVQNYVPADLAKDIDPEWQNPLVTTWSPKVFFYNTDAYGSECPVTNIWQFADPKFAGMLALEDPLQKPLYADWFSDLELNGADALAKAYKSYYGKDLETSEKNAAYEFVARLAANHPVATASDGDALTAAAAAGQDKPPLALVGSDNFSDAQKEGLPLAVCTGIEPWSGFQYPKFVVTTTKGDHPDAAKLFVHFVETAEGIAPEYTGGAEAANHTIPEATDGPPNLTDPEKQLFYLKLDDLDAIFGMRQDTQDAYRAASAK